MLGFQAAARGRIRGEVAEDVLDDGENMLLPGRRSIEDRSVAERRTEDAACAISFDPAHRVILIGARAFFAKAAAGRHVRFRHVDTQQHMLFFLE